MNGTEIGRSVELVMPSVTCCLTGACNLRCVYCRPGGESGDAGVAQAKWDRNLVLAFLAQFRRVGGRVLRVTGGEPLIVPRRLFPFLDAVTENDPYPDMRLATNGVYLARWAEQLASYPFSDVRISLDTVDSYAYLRITGRDALNDVFEGIERGIEVGLPISINAVLTTMSFAGMEAMVDFALQCKVNLKILDYVHHESIRSDGSESSLYASPDNLIERLRARFGKPTTKNLGRGIPMTVFSTGAGTTVIVKDGTVGTRFGVICEKCGKYPCREGLVTCTVTPGAWVMPCSVGRKDLRMALKPSGVKDAVRVILGYFTGLRFEARACSNCEIGDQNRDDAA